MDTRLANTSRRETQPWGGAWWQVPLGSSNTTPNNHKNRHSIAIHCTKMADSLGGALADARVTCSPSADAKCVECADDERVRARTRTMHWTATPSPTMSWRLVCDPFDVLAAQDQSFCAKNGWKIQMHCLESRSGENQTFLEAETSSYIKFDPCPISFSGFVRFVCTLDSNPRPLCSHLRAHLRIPSSQEFFMMLCFALSFYYVQRRKRRLEVIQQWRIASY